MSNDVYDNFYKTLRKHHFSHKFNLISENPQDQNNRFFLKLRVNGITYNGFGKSLKDSKRNAIEKFLENSKDCPSRAFTERLNLSHLLKLDSICKVSHFIIDSFQLNIEVLIQDYSIDEFREAVEKVITRFSNTELHNLSLLRMICCLWGYSWPSLEKSISNVANKKAYTWTLILQNAEDRVLFRDSITESCSQKSKDRLIQKAFVHLSSTHDQGLIPIAEEAMPVCKGKKTKNTFSEDILSPNYGEKMKPVQRLTQLARLIYKREPQFMYFPTVERNAVIHSFKVILTDELSASGDCSYDKSTAKQLSALKALETFFPESKHGEETRSVRGILKQPGNNDPRPAPNSITFSDVIHDCIIPMDLHERRNPFLHRPSQGVQTKPTKKFIKDNYDKKENIFYSKFLSKFALQTFLDGSAIDGWLTYERLSPGLRLLIRNISKICIDEKDSIGSFHSKLKMICQHFKLFCFILERSGQMFHDEARGILKGFSCQVTFDKTISSNSMTVVKYSEKSIIAREQASYSAIELLSRM